MTSEDDDLPDETALAAAIALNASEASGAELSNEKDDETHDAERTMALAPPPPMPVIDDTAINAEPDQDTPETSGGEEIASPTLDENETVDAAGIESDETSGVNANANSEFIATDTETMDQGVAGADADEPEEPASVDALYNDPLIDDAADPMTDAAVIGDFAPGAPDIEFDKDSE